MKKTCIKCGKSRKGGYLYQKNIETGEILRICKKCFRVIFRETKQAIRRGKEVKKDEIEAIRLSIRKRLMEPVSKYYGRPD